MPFGRPVAKSLADSFFQFATGRRHHRFRVLLGYSLNYIHVGRCESIRDARVEITFPEIIANSDLRHGLEFDCNQEASLVRGARPLTDFNSSCISYDF